MQGGPAILHLSDYYRIEVLPLSGIIKVIRLPRRFETTAVIDVACDPVQLTLDQAGRRNHRLLLDTREAIGNNDPKFEKSFEDHRKRMIRGFVRVALLVKSVIGKLHVERLLAEQDPGTHHRVFLDEKAALAYLAEG
ncbi:MAG: hypothetical protein JWP97_4111 [Labilithrix sp.]|nr:hypothetical protein [Labilithrix sp.]